MTSREVFLERVRQAVANGNRAGLAARLSERGSIGFQGAGPDPLARFCDELRKAGGHAHIASDAEAAWQVVHEVIEAKQARNVLLGIGGMVDRLDIAGRLHRDNVNVTTADMLAASSAREACFGADVGISNVAYLIAETGTVVAVAEAIEPRSLSLLPPVHIAVVDKKQLLPDLFDLIELYEAKTALPSCLTLITGPSKTGDIELKLVTGVHGPGEVHVIVCTW